MTTWHKIVCARCGANANLSQRESDGVILCPRDREAAIAAEKTEVPM